MSVRFLYLCWKHRQVASLLAACRRTPEVQRELLFQKIRRNEDSEFGRDHGMSHIRTIEDFRRQVPIVTYEYYRPYVERVKKGNLRAMFGPDTKVWMLAMTSGTTSEPKFIPITDVFLDEYRLGWNLWGLGTYWDHRDLLWKKALQFSSDWQQFSTEGGIPCGNISGLAAEMRPRISDVAFILPRALNKIKDATAKQYTALRIAMASRRVGMIVTANPLTLINLARLADARREELIRDIFDGMLSKAVDVPPEARKALWPQWSRRDPKRARELERIVWHTGHLWPRDFWPRMSVLAVWTSGPMAIYLPQVREYYGDAVFRDHGLSASEGRMTTPFCDNSAAGVPDITSHYFEFIPEEEHDQDQPTVLEAHELEEGRNYFLVMSTSNGMYRYDMHDVVRCVGFEGTAPLLEFQNKGAHYSSMTGEKLSEVQVASALQQGFAEAGISAEHFALAPVFGDPPGYVLLLETDSGPREQMLLERVDSRLCEANFEYANRLETGRLRPLAVQRLPAGTWAEYRRRRLARPGASAEQFKYPCLVGKLGFVEELLGSAAGEVRQSA